MIWFFITSTYFPSLIAADLEIAFTYKSPIKNPYQLNDKGFHLTITLKLDHQKMIKLLQ